MSHRGRSTYRPRGRRSEEEFSQQAQQAGDERRGQDEPPAGNQDVNPDQEINEGAPAVQGPDLEIDVQELDEPKTGRERGDGPDVQGKSLLNPEHIKQPEAGEGQS
ncbi:G antigen 10 [Microcebus murinus]|uniref:G antigen 10 n=1 Tax=Microcebus murinus TaxID=30608 RepID=UPI000642E184|nr:X antigen family member 3-like [Microcebus murinus]